MQLSRQDGFGGVCGREPWRCFALQVGKRRGGRWAGEQVGEELWMMADLTPLGHSGKPEDVVGRDVSLVDAGVEVASREDAEATVRSGVHVHDDGIGLG